MNPFSDRTSAQVAEEAESERAGLVNTLDQLRQNLRPENMVDEMLSQAQSGSSNVMDKVWAVARANPIPAALIGIGAAMLVGAGQRSRKRSGRDRATWPEGDRGAMDPDLSPGWSDDPVPSTDYAMSTYTTRPRSALGRLIDEQPLILAALGVAVGAAVGSAIRSTDVEGQWLGDASESMRRNAGNLARDGITQLRTAAGETLDQIRATAAEHGVSADNVSGLVHDLGDDVRTAAASLGGRPGSDPVR